MAARLVSSQTENCSALPSTAALRKSWHRPQTQGAQAGASTEPSFLLQRPAAASSRFPQTAEWQLLWKFQIHRSRKVNLSALIFFRTANTSCIGAATRIPSVQDCTLVR